MKILDPSSITNTSQMPLKKGTLQFLQDSYREIVQAVMQALIGTGYNPATVYVLYGCVNTSTAPLYNVTAGAIFYAGKIYVFNSASFTAANTAVISIIQTQYTTDADPVTFTDTTVRNIHNIFNMQVSDGAAGSTIANFGQLFYLNFTIPQLLNLTTSGVASLTGAYPNLNINVPTPATSVNPILTAGYYNVGDIPSGGGQDYPITFASAISTANYYIMGTLLSQGNNAGDDTSCFFTVRAKTTTGFTLHVREASPLAQNLGFDYIIFAK